MKVKSGKRKKRAVRPVEKNLVTGYDSNWEYLLHQGILKDWEHHKEKPVEYIVEHKYNPDFVRLINGKKILLESKGRFWDYSEYSKYVWIKKVLPPDVELVFLFAEPNAPMPAAKRRKDGTKRSHAEWAWANDFKWYSVDTIPESWIDETARNKETTDAQY